MHRLSVIVALALAGLAAAVRRVPAVPAPATACTCQDPSLCRPAYAPPNNFARDKEVFGFVGGGQTEDTFPNFDWTTVSTVAWGSDPELICEAHKHGARVVLSAPAFDLGTVNIPSYVNTTITAVVAGNYDGVTFDYESPIAATDKKDMETYVALVKATTDQMHRDVKNSQISVCVAWSPDDIDGRAYDAVGLADAADLLYIMAYDTRSQIYGRCIASANSPSGIARRSVQRYTDLGISPSKLVLGTPWYGYDYPCTGDMALDAVYCPIREVPFRGVNCSDAAGIEVGFAQIMTELRSGNASKLILDTSTQSPYFNYRHSDGTVHQIWFDNAESSAVKYAIASAAGLRGVGPYTFDDLVYTTDIERADAAAMWAALRQFAA